jgi:hypothetical protein
MSAFDRSELDGYEALVSELRANPPVAPERLRRRVLDGAPVPRGRMSRKRRLFLVVVPVAAVLAVGAALVHGFVSTGSNGRSTAATALVHRAAKAAHSIAQGPATTTPQSAHARERELGPAGKKTRSAPSAYSADTPTTQNNGDLLALSGNAHSQALAPQASQKAVAIPTNRLVHAVASLQVRVKSRSELSAKTNQASQIVGSLGGYAQSVRYQNSQHGYGEAVLALRVPVQKAEAAIADLSKLGTLLSQQVSTQDLQAKLNHQNSGIGSLRRAIAVYQNALASTTLPASQRVIIQIRLNNARRALAQLRHARKGTLASGATADISLLLTTQNHAIVVHHHHGSTRVGRLLGSAAHFLALEGIIVLYALIVLAPVVLLGALAWWILRERRRREERLLASA